MVNIYRPTFGGDDGSGMSARSVLATIGSMISRRDAVEDQNILITHLVIWLFAIFAGGLLVLRIVTKLQRKIRLWADDFILIAAWVFLVFYDIVSSLELGLGEGKHLTGIKAGTLPALLLLSDVSATLSITAIAWSKTSFAVTLLRITTATSSPARYGIWAIIASVNVVLGGAAILVWVQCMPIARAWDSSIEGTCLPGNITVAVAIAASAFSSAMDIVLVVISWKIIWSLSMRPTEKLAVGATMSMGVLAAIAAAIKCVEIATSDPTDFTFTAARIIIWGVAEPALTIIAAAMPSLRMLVKEDRDRTQVIEASSSAPIARPLSPEMKQNITAPSIGGAPPSSGGDSLRHVHSIKRSGSRATNSPMSRSSSLSRPGTSTSNSVVSLGSNAPNRPPPPRDDQSWWSSWDANGGPGSRGASPNGQPRGRPGPGGRPPRSSPRGPPGRSPGRSLSNNGGRRPPPMPRMPTLPQLIPGSNPAYPAPAVPRAVAPFNYKPGSDSPIEDIVSSYGNMTTVSGPRPGPSPSSLGRNNSYGSSQETPLLQQQRPPADTRYNNPPPRPVRNLLYQSYKRLSILREEASARRGSSVSREQAAAAAAANNTAHGGGARGFGNYISNGFYNGYSNSKNFVETYGSKANDVLKSLELVVPLGRQQATMAAKGPPKVSAPFAVKSAWD